MNLHPVIFFEENSVANLTGASNAVTLMDPITDPRWDSFVQKHPYALIYHTAGWKRVLEKSFRHMKGYYFILTEASGEDIRAALPVYIVKSWLLGKRLVSLPFATIWDPLVSNAAELETLLEAVIRFLSRSKASHLEIRALQSFLLMEGIKSHKLSCLKQFKHHYLHLSSDPEEVRKKFHQKSVRSAISKAERSGISLNSDNTGSELRDFYTLYVNTRKKLGLPPQPFNFFKNIWDEFSRRDLFKIFIANYRGAPVAGLAFFKFKKRISTEFAGWDVRFKDIKPNNFLYWEAIKSGCEQRFETFDFGRTSQDNKGLLNFKRHWGCNEVDIRHFYYPDETVKNTQVGLQRKIIKGLINDYTPNLLARILGNYCYRHLG